MTKNNTWTVVYIEKSLYYALVDFFLSLLTMAL